MPLLPALIRAGHEVVLVVAAPSRPRGRGRRIEPGPVEHAARELDCAVALPEDPNAPGFAEQLRSYQPEVAVLAAYRFILRPGLLAVPKLGFINVHPSLLPRYRGAAPIQRAIMAGERQTGVSIIQLSREVDAGDIIARQPVDIGPDETAGELAVRLAELGARLLVDVLARVAEGPLARTVQDPAGATSAPRLTKADRCVNWHESADRVHNRIRGLAPEPAAACLFRGRRLLLLGSRLVSEGGEENRQGRQDRQVSESEGGSENRQGRQERRVPVEVVSDHAPGEILLERPGLVVAVGQGSVELTLVKPDGSRIQTGAAFRNGHRLAPGERLVSL